MGVAAERILIVGPAWIGDMVMAQSLFRALCEQRPGAQLDVLAPEWSLPLLARMPEVRRGIALPLGHGQLGLGARYRLGRSLRAEHYTQAIVLPRSFKAALVPFFARIPRRTGYRGELRYGLLNDIRPLDKARLPQVVQRYLALGQGRDAPLPPTEVPLPRLRDDAASRERLLQAFGLDLERPVIGLMPGAEYGPAKRWPVEHFAALARRFAAEGYSLWQFGSARDRAVAEKIDAAAGRVSVNLCGRTRLEEAVDLIAATRAVVSNDSGLMHVAAAVGVPLVALYGSSSPAYTPPLGERAAVLHLGLECSPCFERECRFGHYRCLQAITPEMVAERLQQLLADGNSQ